MPDALIAVGLSHHTAPVQVRERVVLGDNRVTEYLRTLRDDGLCSEAFLLSTCNRVELYAVPGPAATAQDPYLFGTFRGPGGEQLDRYLYRHSGRAAVLHLFRVAASLDSLVIGEPQILGQVKTAIRTAQEVGTLGRILHPLAERTLAVAKRVRNQTAIGRSRVGIGNAGVDLAMQIFGELKDHRAMLIGAGEMGRQVARALLGAGLEELIVANRTHASAIEVAEQHGGTAITFDRVEDYLPRVDIVITATGAPNHVLTQRQVKRAIRQRRYRSMFLVDLSVPRNIDPAVDQLDEAFLFNIDDLVQVVDKGLAERAQAADSACQLVETEADRYVAALAQVDVNARIGALNRHIEMMRVAELERSRRLVEALDDTQRKDLEALTRAIVKKVLHGPMVAVREAARSGDADLAEKIVAAWLGEDK